MLGCSVAALAAVFGAPASAQTLTDTMLNPQPEAARAPPELAGSGTARVNDYSGRVSKPPAYGQPAASGAGDNGFDSLNRKRKKRKPYPGARPLKPGDPDTQTPPVAVPNAALRTPIAAAVAGKVPGQPTRRALKVEDDPFGPVGFYVGSMLTKTAVELSGGYDSNPARIVNGAGSSFLTLAPELLMTSDWSRHALTVDLKGSYVWYQTSPGCSCAPGSSTVPASLDRPDVTGKIAGRIDVSRDLRIDSEARLRVATDNPGSPNISAGLARYVNYATVGSTVGAVQRFNRLELGISGAVDRTAFEWSELTNGVTTSNHDRDFTQYALIGRAAYEATPGVKPFVEATLDERLHDTDTDRSGYKRDSRGLTVRAGSTFELSRLMTGEVSIGYLARSYSDTRLGDVGGMLTSASLVWTASPLTTVRLSATSTVDETTLAGVAASVSRSYTAQVDHNFRRWLVGTLKFSLGNTTYGEGGRSDTSYSTTAGLVYKFSRTVHLKGEFRQDWIRSNVAGSDYTASVITVGLRFQR